MASTQLTSGRSGSGSAIEWADSGSVFDPNSTDGTLHTSAQITDGTPSVGAAAGVPQGFLQRDDSGLSGGVMASQILAAADTKFDSVRKAASLRQKQQIQTRLGIQRALIQRKLVLERMRLRSQHLGQVCKSYTNRMASLLERYQLARREKKLRDLRVKYQKEIRKLQGKFSDQATKQEEYKREGETIERQCPLFSDLRQGSSFSERAAFSAFIMADAGARAILHRLIMKENAGLVWGLLEPSDLGVSSGSHAVTTTNQVLQRVLGHIEVFNDKADDIKKIDGVPGQILRVALRQPLLGSTTQTIKAIREQNPKSPFYAEILNEISIDDIELDTATRSIQYGGIGDGLSFFDDDDADEYEMQLLRAEYRMNELPDDDRKADRGDAQALNRLMQDIEGDDQERDQRQKEYEANMHILQEMKIPQMVVEPGFGGGKAIMAGKQVDPQLYGKDKVVNMNDPSGQLAFTGVAVLNAGRYDSDPNLLEQRESKATARLSKPAPSTGVTKPRPEWMRRSKRRGSQLVLRAEDLDSTMDISVEGPLLEAMSKKQRRYQRHDADGNLQEGLQALALPVEIREVDIKEIVQERKEARTQVLMERLSERMYRSMHRHNREVNEFGIPDVSAFFEVQYTDKGPAIHRFAKVATFQTYEEQQATGQAQVKDLFTIYRSNLRKSLRRLAFLHEYHEEAKASNDMIEELAKPEAGDLVMMQIVANTRQVKVTLANLLMQIEGAMVGEEQRAKYHSFKMVRLAVAIYSKALQQEQTLRQLLDSPEDEDVAQRQKDLEEMRKVTRGRYSLEEMRRMQQMQRAAARATRVRRGQMVRRMVAKIQQTKLFQLMCKGVRSDGSGLKLVPRVGTQEDFPSSLRELDLNNLRDIEMFLRLAQDPNSMYTDIVIVHDESDDISGPRFDGGRLSAGIDVQRIAAVRETLGEDRSRIAAARQVVMDMVLGITRDQILHTNLRSVKLEHASVVRTINHQMDKVIQIIVGLRKVIRGVSDLTDVTSSTNKPRLLALKADAEKVEEYATKVLKFMSDSRTATMQQYRTWRDYDEDPNAVRPISTKGEKEALAAASKSLLQIDQTKPEGSSVSSALQRSLVVDTATARATTAAQRLKQAVDMQVGDVKLVQQIGKSAAVEARTQALQAGVSKADATKLGDMAREAAIADLKKGDGRPGSARRSFVSSQDQLADMSMSALLADLRG